MRKAGFKTVTSVLCLTVIADSLCSGCENSQESLKLLEKYRFLFRTKKFVK